jgi:hypothetical protein
MTRRTLRLPADPVACATLAAIGSALRELAPTLDAQAAADAASTLPLLGDRWGWPAYPADVDAPCAWRTEQDAHCRCWRCHKQPLELLLARAIVRGVDRCARRRAGEPCYWCQHAADPKAYAPGIVRGALALASAVPPGAA